MNNDAIQLMLYIEFFCIGEEKEMTIKEGQTRRISSENVKYSL